MTPYGLGRLPAPDERDRLHRMTSHLAIGEPLPNYRYYSTAGVLDQSTSPMCVAYAWRGWLSAGTVINRGGPDPATIYHAAQQVDEWDGDQYDGTSVRAGAKVLQADGFITSYLWAWTPDVVAQWLLSGRGPVVLGTNWYDSMFDPDRSGVVHIGGDVAGGHAYLCVGYNRTTGRFRFQNSWGRSWGQNGRFWMAGEDVGRLLSEDGECATSMEVRL